MRPFLRCAALAAALVVAPQRGGGADASPLAGLSFPEAFHEAVAQDIDRLLNDDTQYLLYCALVDSYMVFAKERGQGVAAPVGLAGLFDAKGRAEITYCQRTVLELAAAVATEGAHTRVKPADFLAIDPLRRSHTKLLPFAEMAMYVDTRIVDELKNLVRATARSQIDYASALVNRSLSAGLPLCWARRSWLLTTSFGMGVALPTDEGECVVRTESGNAAPAALKLVVADEDEVVRARRLVRACAIVSMQLTSQFLIQLPTLTGSSDMGVALRSDRLAAASRNLDAVREIVRRRDHEEYLLLEYSRFRRGY